MSALRQWAARHLASEQGGLVLDPEETEMALAVYARAMDEQLDNVGGKQKKLRELFPNIDMPGGR